MAIESPSTYGDYYWAQQVEASKFFADESEKTMSPYVRSLLADIPLIPEFPRGAKKFIEGMSEPSSFAFLPFMAGVGINAIDEMLDIAFEPAMLALKRNYGKRFKSKWLNVAEVNTLWARNKITEGLWDEVIAAEGYEAVLGSSLFESQLPYPSIPDVVLYSRYHGLPDAPLSEFQKWYNISPRDWPVWKWLSLQRFTTDQIQSLFKRGLISDGEIFDEFAKIGWSPADRPLVRDLSYLLPNAMLLVQGDLQQGAGRADILRDISRADIHPDYAHKYLDAILTKPASADLVAYELRRDPTLSNLGRRLAKIGIHPDYFDIYKTLANPIPPVADIITMAVREAFTPEIAARFGQYEDFPSEFERYAAMKGLTKEWAQRYWAAHWALPSATQGFNMLHRGIINKDELTMLLRAQDVMPFWRDRLIKVAYRPLTRVDVRRMYKEGVLDETGVYEAYLDHGYNEDNAKAMTEFTIRYVLGQLTKFTGKDVITAYTKRMIDRGEASSLLRDLGVRYEDVSYILSTADYKREWELTDAKVSGIRNLYKRRVYDENKTRGELLKLDLPTEQVDVLMQQWYYEVKDEPTATWTTAQTLKFIKAGLISSERGRRELQQIGYDSEHINVYMRSIE